MYPLPPVKPRRTRFTTEEGEKYEENVVPQAIAAIQRREDPTIPALGGLNIKGILPPSTKPEVDEVVYGVAT